MTNTDLTLTVRSAFADVLDVIPPRLRTAIAVAAVVVAVLALGAQQIVAIWWPEGREQVDATVARIVPWMLFVIGVVTTAYRPTRGEIAARVVEPGPLEMARAQEAQANTIATLSAHGWSKDEATSAVRNQELMPGGESAGSPGAQKDAGGAQAAPGGGQADTSSPPYATS